MTALEVRLLGPIDVVVDGEITRPSAPKVRMLLAMLALDANQPVSTEALADRLWAGAPPATAASVLRTYITQLRRILPDGAARLERDGDGYRLRLGPDELDSARFHAAIAAAGEPRLSKSERAGVLRVALSCWRGDPLAELADDPRARTEAVRLAERRWEAVESLADVQLDLGLHDTVATELQAAVQEEPLREQLAARLMLALYRCGRQADALAAFQRLRRDLVEGLGLEPSPELRKLEAAILDQDPALSAPARRLGNVPATLSSFVGRQDELDRLLAALATHRLVTLTGPGGCGKTRLALEAAARVDDRPDGAWFVDLTARRHPADVASAVLSAVGIDQRPDESSSTTLHHALGDRRLLLVLDNCEHLVAACAELASSLLGSAADIAVLATSRSTLAVPGEQVWHVPPLAVPSPGDDPSAVARSPAAQLLADRITEARGGRSLRGDEWPAVAELCQRLDGLPLAIELVAAKGATLSVTDLAEAVGRQVIEGDARAFGPEHHRSVAACVHWSLALLDDEHRRLLRRACLLPGAFSAAAAAAVAGLAQEGDALAGLAHLAGQSLLQPQLGARSRFRVLETVRQVVGATVDDAEAEEALDGLVRWAALQAESAEPLLRGPDAVRLLDDLEADLEPLRVALDHGLSRPDPTDGVRIAASISALWAYRGYLVEGDQWLTRALGRSGEVTPTLRMHLLVASGTHRMTLGDVDGLRRNVDAALTLARASGEAAPLLRTLLWAAHAVRLHGGNDAAAALYQDAFTLAGASHDESSVASALAGLGDVAAGRGDLDEAATLHLRALAAFRSAGDPHGHGQALLNVAEVDRRAGRHTEADAGFTEAAEVFATISDRSCMAACGEGRARVATDAGGLDAAARLYRSAIDVRRELHQDRHAEADLVALAAVLADAGRPLEAASALGEAGDDVHPLAQALRRQLGDRPYLTAWADGRLARHAPPG